MPEGPDDSGGIKWGDISGIPDALGDFLAGPKKYILGTVLVFVAQSLLGITSYFIEGILAVYGVVAGVPSLVVDPVVDGGRAIGDLFLELVGIVVEILATLVGAGGPFGALLSIAFGFLLVLALIELLSAAKSFGPFGRFLP